MKYAELPDYFWQDPNDPTLFHPTSSQAKRGVQSMEKRESNFGVFYMPVGSPEFEPEHHPEPHKTLARLAAKISGINELHPDDDREWPWTGAVTRPGYPVTKYKGSVRLVAPLLFEILYRPVPLGCHLQTPDGSSLSRRNVNPAHRIPVRRNGIQNVPAPQSSQVVYDEETVEEILHLINDRDIKTKEQFDEEFLPDLFDATQADIDNILEKAGLSHER